MGEVSAPTRFVFLVALSDAQNTPIVLFIYTHGHEH
jgi:hypothetical protein